MVNNKTADEIKFKAVELVVVAACSMMGYIHPLLPNWDSLSFQVWQHQCTATTDVHSSTSSYSFNLVFLHILAVIPLIFLLLPPLLHLAEHLEVVQSLQNRLIIRRWICPKLDN
jgi:hypothetical protein